MNNIANYILKKYGFVLSKSEIEEFIKWFKDNESKINNEYDMDNAAKKYLYNKYKDRPRKFFGEDLSNMEYLLALLKKEVENK